MAAPSNAEILATCIVQAPPIPPPPELQRQVVNRNLNVGKSTIATRMYVELVDPEYVTETGTVDFYFLEPPFPSPSGARIVLDLVNIDQTNLLLFAGNNRVLDDGRIDFGNLNITAERPESLSTTLVSSLNCSNTNQESIVYSAFQIKEMLINVVQGSTEQITGSKTTFNYEFVPGPNFIRFQSELLTNGMVFLKDTSGLNNLAGVTMSLDILPTPPPPAPPPRAPILTINNVPNSGGFCSAMLIII